MVLRLSGTSRKQNEVLGCPERQWAEIPDPLLNRVMGIPDEAREPQVITGSAASGRYREESGVARSKDRLRNLNPFPVHKTQGCCQESALRHRMANGPVI